MELVPTLQVTNTTMLDKLSIFHIRIDKFVINLIHEGLYIGTYRVSLRLDFDLFCYTLF